jgi:hypothetical protein
MYKTIVPEENPHMGDVIPAVVGTDKEDQITSFQGVPVWDNLSVTGLLLGTAREFDPVGRERSISQSGTVHASGGNTPHAMGSAQVFFSCADHLVGFDTVCSKCFTGATAEKSL